MDFFICGIWTTKFRGYSLLYIQELLLAVLRGPYRVTGIKPGLVLYKTNTLPYVLSPHFPLEFILYRYNMYFKSELKSSFFLFIAHMRTNVLYY